MRIAMLMSLLGIFLLAVSVLNLRAGEKQIRYEMPHRFAVEDPQFLRCMGQLLGPGVLSGNRVKALQNGEQIFPAMLDAIRSARQSITFETYIYWSGDIGKKFSEALCARARAGVKVHVMLDWVGCGKMEGKYLDELKPVGDSLAQVFKSSRGEGSESVRLMYLLSIASATRTIRLSAAYFVSGVPVTDPRFLPKGGPAPQFLMKEHPPVEKPLMTIEPHASVVKMDFSPSEKFGFKGQMFLAASGDYAPATALEQKRAGYWVKRIDLATGKAEPFFALKKNAMGEGDLAYVTTAGPKRPVDVRFSGDALYVVDIGAVAFTQSGVGPAARPFPGSGVVWRITNEGER